MLKFGTVATFGLGGHFDFMAASTYIQRPHL